MVQALAFPPQTILPASEVHWRALHPDGTPWMAMTTWRKLVLLLGLYVSQGLPYGFFTQALPTRLRQEGASLEGVGLASLLALPWAAKFLWAPLVDRFGGSPLGRRRGWILPLQLGAALLLVGLAAISPQQHLGWLFAAVVATNLLAATQDIAADALAVDLLDVRERGLGNGVQVAGYRAGMILGGGALLMAFDRLGWSGTFLAMAALLAVATVPMVLYREPVWEPVVHEKMSYSHSAFTFLRRRGMGPWVATLLTFKAGEAAETAMLRPLLVDRGLGLADIGWLLGTVGFTAGLVGALIGGWLAGAIGRRRALLLCGIAQALGLSVWVAPALGRAAYLDLAWLVGAEHLTSGMATAALFTAMMDRSQSVSAASDYTLQASIVVAGTGAAAALSGFAAQAIGYAGLFAACAALAVGAAGLAAWSASQPSSSTTA